MSGRKHSDILKEQVAEDGGCGIGGPLRFNNAIIFWLYCEPVEHDARIDQRADAAIRDGLVAELTAFHDKYNKQRIVAGEPTDYTKGIFQSIGLKEFHEYLILDEEHRNSESGQKLFESSVKVWKQANKRYARYQNKTIKNRFLGHPGRQVPPIYKLDTTDVSKWNINVFERALDIINNYQNGTESVYKPEPFAINLSYSDGNNPLNSNYCETCQRVIVGDKEYKLHVQSNKHRKMLKRAKKLLEEGNSEKSKTSGEETTEKSKPVVDEVSSL